MFKFFKFNLFFSFFIISSNFAMNLENVEAVIKKSHKHEAAVAELQQILCPRSPKPILKRTTSSFRLPDKLSLDFDQSLENLNDQNDQDIDWFEKSKMEHMVRFAKFHKELVSIRIRKK